MHHWRYGNHSWILDVLNSSKRPKINWKSCIYLCVISLLITVSRNVSLTSTKDDAVTCWIIKIVTFKRYVFSQMTDYTLDMHFASYDKLWSNMSHSTACLLPLRWWPWVNHRHWELIRLRSAPHARIDGQSTILQPTAGVRMRRLGTLPQTLRYSVYLWLDPD